VPLARAAAHHPSDPPFASGCRALSATGGSSESEVVQIAVGVADPALGGIAGVAHFLERGGDRPDQSPPPEAPRVGASSRCLTQRVSQRQRRERRHEQV
jgi:hypothetical protein